MKLSIKMQWGCNFMKQLVLFVKNLLGISLTEDEKYFKKFGQTREEFYAEIERYNQAHRDAVARANQQFLNKHMVPMTAKFVEERKSLW